MVSEPFGVYVSFYYFLEPQEHVRNRTSELPVPTGARTVSYSRIPFASDRRETRESGAETATGARTESHDGITCA